jgi:pimeloyl-ACP methyl ester carboxylesterase
MACLSLLLTLVLTTFSGLRAGQDASPHTEHMLTVGGTKLHYLDWGGTGNLMLLITGYGAEAHVFDELALKFRSRFHVVAMTRRGRAPSDAPRAGYDLETLGLDLKALMDAVGGRRVHLVAHSLGGAEATWLAGQYPDRIGSVVYLDAALNPAVGEAVIKASPFPSAEPRPGTPYAEVRRWWTSYSPDFSTVRSPAVAFYALQDHPPVPADVPPALREQAEAYWQTKWLPAVRDMIDKFRRAAPKGRVVVFENTGHYLFQEREADVVREMTALYDSLR